MLQTSRAYYVSFIFSSKTMPPSGIRKNITVERSMLSSTGRAIESTRATSQPLFLLVNETRFAAGKVAIAAKGFDRSNFDLALPVEKVAPDFAFKNA
jgi:hypothetical protein